ncbi:MAG: hypothetical protein K0S09_2034 [Sphingobacteriaceae bacterium]|jgi:hypothetical protein|nr:hypothetical protein [Sphingobacteriaceae bacterium]
MNFRRFSIFAFLLLLIYSCRKEDKFTDSPDARLSLSSDSVLFDTVFTSINSTTQQIQVFNYNKNAVRISEIRLAGGSASPFQLNINGTAAISLGSIELRGNDSLNVFIKVMINPTTGNLPFFVKDSITFLTNGNKQTVHLRAVGQNAHILKDAVISQNTLWDNKIPYLIYNTLRVSSNSTLTIPAGTKAYFHKDSKMQVDGTLIVNGTLTDSVVFASDRLERIYRDEPGQWTGLHFTGTSKDNKIIYAVIKNGITGIQCDSLAASSPKLLVANTTIKNMQVAGFAGYKTNITAFNNVFFNCGQYLLYGAFGGDYNLKQNTFANYSNSFPRRTPSLFFTDVDPSTSKTAALSGNLVNNIIWGSLAEEIAVEKKGTSVSLSFQNNFIKTSNASFAQGGNILNTDPQFISYRDNNYRLSPSSPALNKGANLSTDPYYNQYLKTDKAGKTRLFPSEPGAYEAQ